MLNIRLEKERNFMKLSELLKNIEVKEMKNILPEQEISAVAYHSGKVEKNGLFVCIKGYKTDGHKYLQNAKDNGAVVAIVEEFQNQVDIPQIRVKNSRIALATAGANYYSNPSEKLTVIGITATNGKTTTAFMVDEILKCAGIKTGIVGTVMIKAGDEMIPSELTTPESLDLQKYMAKMVEFGVTHLTMEVSSSALDLHRVHDTDFDLVCFNNISREHIDLHGSFEEYFSIKSSLLKNAKRTAKAVINADEERISDLQTAVLAQTCTYTVEKKDGDLQCENLDLSTGRATWTVKVTNQNKFSSVQKNLPDCFDIQLSVPGYHSVYNAMAAIELCLLAGVEVLVIQKGLYQFRGVERRFQFLYEEEFKIIDDHFANAGNINVTLSTLEKMKYNHLHLVYAIRGNRGVIVNEENARMMARWLKKLPIKTLVATKSISHTGEKDAVTEQETDIFQSVMKEQGMEVAIYDELSDAVDVALSHVGKDDVILLAGCQGMDSGGKIILQKLSEGKSEEEKNKIMSPVKDRMCGI